MHCSDDTLYMLALSRLSFFHLAEMRLLLDRAGSAKTLFEHRGNIREIMPECNGNIVSAFCNSDEALRRAEVEMEWAERHGIQILPLNDDLYPLRLRECPDAPLSLFFMGNADLNKRRIVSVVGTRRCTPYGRDITERFVRELQSCCPDVLVTSGLAYGIDVVAHRTALESGLQTVGVLAHGLDTIYPASHRKTAKEMIGQGGLLTEYFQQTGAERQNFLRRNRIVAGMADATIVIESAYRGGSLSTARIANEYNREVFAVPGRVGDLSSEGCNRLILTNRAQIFTSTEDFLNAMGWNYDGRLKKAQSEGIQPDLFPNLQPEEQKVVDVLRSNNDLQINILSVQTGINIPELSAILFNLEMEGIVKALPGGVYHKA